MKRQDYILKIDKPCDKEWNSMSKTDIGKFCSHCSKTVVDFTKLTDNEIINVIENNSSKLCGRLSQQQLNRVLEINQPSNKPQIYKFLAGLMLVGISENSYATSMMSPKIEITSTKDAIQKQPDKQDEVISDSLKNVIQGKVLDAESNEPLPFANILIKNTQIGTITDNQGNYILEIPDSLLSEEIILVVNYIGYQKSETVINKNDLPISKELLIISQELHIIGLMVVVKEKKWWQFWKRKHKKH